MYSIVRYNYYLNKNLREIGRNLKNARENAKLIQIEVTQKAESRDY